jgi:hypothetical protein
MTAQDAAERLAAPAQPAVAMDVDSTPPAPAVPPSASVPSPFLQPVPPDPASLVAIPHIPLVPAAAPLPPPLPPTAAAAPSPLSPPSPAAAPSSVHASASVSSASSSSSSAQDPLPYRIDADGPDQQPAADEFAAIDPAALAALLLVELPRNGPRFLKSRDEFGHSRRSEFDTFAVNILSAAAAAICPADPPAAVLSLLHSQADSKSRKRQKPKEGLCSAAPSLAADAPFWTPATLTGTSWQGSTATRPLPLCFSASAIWVSPSSAISLIRSPPRRILPSSSAQQRPPQFLPPRLCQLHQHLCQLCRRQHFPLRWASSGVAGLCCSAPVLTPWVKVSCAISVLSNAFVFSLFINGVYHRSYTSHDTRSSPFCLLFVCPLCVFPPSAAAQKSWGCCEACLTKDWQIRRAR